MDQRLKELSSQEWLLTNGLGGFASGTVAGCATRRYHSLLTVALDPPSGRRMSLLGGLDETVIVDGVEYPLATHVYEDGTVYPNGWEHITGYTVSPRTVVWEFTFPNGCRLTKTLYQGNNIECFRCLYEATAPLSLRIAPLVCWKDYHATMQRWDGFPFRSEIDTLQWTYQPTTDSPAVTFRSSAGVWTTAGWWNERLFYRQEAARGFSATEELYCPVVLEHELSPKNGVQLTLHATLRESTQRPIHRKITSDARASFSDCLRTFDFLVGGQDCRATILAGYPWFTDWGRDTFISLPGLCLTTGRIETARQIVRDFAPWVRNGRIPNRFPDNHDEPAYNNVDGTLWYVRAMALCGLTDALAPTLDAIIDAHLSGTVGDGIFCDDDGLLRCGTAKTNLTWMDAKVDGVPITPRFDRPVEVQALWINAMIVAGRDDLATKALATFIGRFVRADGLGLYDCLLPDGSPDTRIRPNQVIAAALLDLPDTVNRAILRVATDHLLTPYGLRTLSPTDPRFCPRYEGDGRQRDAAYHQGTVWPWLIGSFCDLVKKVHGPDADTEPLLAALRTHQVKEYGLGGIAEVFDGKAPHRPNGCPWQAWSLAEVLRAKG